jgi:hypothetical protein
MPAGRSDSIQKQQIVGDLISFLPEQRKRLHTSADRVERTARKYEAYAKVSLKKYKPTAARNEDKNVPSGLL